MPKLLPFQQTPNATCTALKKYAWKTHEACYLRCGIRDISTETMQLLFETYDSNYYVGVEACKQLLDVLSREWMPPIVVGR